MPTAWIPVAPLRDAESRAERFARRLRSSLAAQPARLFIIGFSVGFIHHRGGSGEVPNGFQVVASGAAVDAARQALAFVARRQGRSTLDAATWRHVMSLELGWMGPGDAKRYVDACAAAGLLEADGDALSLTFDPRGVEVARGFRPDPSDLPEPGRARPVAQDAGGAAAPVATDEAADDADLFTTWLPRVAKARGEDAGATMAAVEQMQEATGGMLHAEAALLFLARDAGLDVKDAAGRALADLKP